MKRVLITGASGFVGKNLVEYLLEKKIETVTISRSEVGDYKKIDAAIINSQHIHAIVHLAGKAYDLRNIGSKEDYYEANTKLTKNIFDIFLASEAKIFITLSSVKAVADQIKSVLTEECSPKPLTHYGKSKLQAEQYIFSNSIPNCKRVYVLRPCLIHGPGNKGNLNFLYKIVSKNIPWPLGAFENSRSFCGIDNLLFVLNELIERDDISSGIYNMSDDEPLSTNELIRLIAEFKKRKPIIWRTYKGLIELVAIIGDKLNLPLNSERLQKLTNSQVVSNQKIKNAIGKSLPFSSRESLFKTFKSFDK